MHKVIVTGASGFIGRHIVDILINKNYEVHAISRNQFKNRKIIWHQCDLLNKSSIINLLHKINAPYLIHLAWYVEHDKFWEAPQNNDWKNASYRLLSYFYHSGGTRAIFAGSCTEYDWNQDGYFDEINTALRPNSFYGKNKLELFKKVDKYCSKVGLSYAWGRIFFIYGPYENKNRLIPYLICTLLDNRIAICKQGTAIRDYIYIKDVASAFVALLESNVTGPINIASGKPIMIKDIAEIISSKLNKKELIKFESERPEHSSVMAATAKLNYEVKWIPKYNIERGIIETIEWWRKNHESKNSSQNRT